MMAYFAGVATPFVVGAFVLVIGYLRSTGYEVMCDRHDWSTGNMHTTRRWRLIARKMWHTYRWHRFGKSRSWATDAQLAYWAKKAAR